MSEAQEFDFSLTDEQKAELDRRIAEADAHPDGGVPWSEIKARVLRSIVPNQETPDGGSAEE